ncbi:MAG: DUF4348 domain-containing protein [Flavobacteriaceae bacterium]|nr:DUF4348 domain-containing protein [Flavobacteriaceae bacterium]
MKLFLYITLSCVFFLTIINREQLEYVVTAPEQKDCRADFEKFLYRFESDSIFQKSRLKFPLLYRYSEEIEVEGLRPDCILDMREYHLFAVAPKAKAASSTATSANIEMDIPNKIAYYTIKNSQKEENTKYVFRLIKNCWYLVSIYDGLRE